MEIRVLSISAFECAWELGIIILTDTNLRNYKSTAGEILRCACMILDVLTLLQHTNPLMERSLFPDNFGGWRSRETSWLLPWVCGNKIFLYFRIWLMYIRTGNKDFDNSSNYWRSKKHYDDATKFKILYYGNKNYHVDYFRI